MQPRRIACSRPCFLLGVDVAVASEIGTARQSFAQTPHVPPSPSELQATGTEFRTAALWGVGWTAPYLHDGRAATLEDAILAHGGEAQASSNAFAALPEADRIAPFTYLRFL